MFEGPMIVEAGSPLSYSPFLARSGAAEPLGRVLIDTALNPSSLLQLPGKLLDLRSRLAARRRTRDLMEMVHAEWDFTVGPGEAGLPSARALQQAKARLGDHVGDRNAVADAGLSHPVLAALLDRADDLQSLPATLRAMHDSIDVVARTGPALVYVTHVEFPRCNFRLYAAFG